MSRQEIWAQYWDLLKHNKKLWVVLIGVFLTFLLLAFLFLYPISWTPYMYLPL